MFLEQKETIEGFLENHPLLGWSFLLIAFVWRAAKSLIKNVPEFLKLRAKIILPIAKIIKFKKLQKTAIRSDVQGQVNYAVKKIVVEAPEGNIKPLEIEWVEGEEAVSLLREGKILVRIRPLENQEDNFLVVTQLYLESVLMPNSRPLLAESQKKAVTYFTAEQIVGAREKLHKKLHNDYYVPDTKRHKNLRGYFEQIQKANDKGLFFSVVLRVLERGTSALRFKKGTLEREFDEVLEHIVEFATSKPREDKLWHYLHEGTSFSLLLVAEPYKAKFLGTQGYVNRVKENLKHTDYVFVVFSETETNFGQRVTNAIKEFVQVELVETIRTQKDYRGNPGGLVRVYRKK